MLKYFLILITFIVVSCGQSGSSNTSDSSSDVQANYQKAIKKYDKTATKPPKSITESFMYVNGYKTSANMRKEGLYLDVDYFIQGMVDGFKNDGKGLISESQMDSVLEGFAQYLTVRMDSLTKFRQIEQSVLAVKNLTEAEIFLEKNKNEKGIVALPSGLQYKILTEGKGIIPTPTDHVLVHMTSTFSDGTEFDDTRKRGEPRLIPNERMILGWVEAITKMPVGSRWIVYMPPALAFGEFGADRVPPNKMTIVDVELIRILDKSEVQDYLKQHPESSPTK